MSRTYNHRSEKSLWKSALKRQTNKKIRRAPIMEWTGVSDFTRERMEDEVIKNINFLASDDAREMFDYIDALEEREYSYIPCVTKYRFWMD